MLGPHRRNVLAGTILASGSAFARGSGVSAADNAQAAARTGGDLKRYADFGGKQAGGPGDIACGEWLESELRALGYVPARQSYAVPFFDVARAEIVCGGARAAVRPQPIVVPTGEAGMTARLVRVDPRGHSGAPLGGAIALVELPFGRSSSVLAKPVRTPIDAAFASGARAVVAITHGPTGKVIALNADGRAPTFPGPVALLAPADAGPFLDAATGEREATMTVTGRGGRREAFNLVGKLDRGRGRWLVVSTPRSGWYGCVGERGPGIAIWLALARWARRALPGHDLAFVCNSGHEYEYLGAAEALDALVPAPPRTAFWLHLGAAAAARDWHELPGGWQPLPGIDSQRCLSVSPALLAAAKRVFAGHAGFEHPYSTDTLTAGELTGIVEAGYPRVAGCFGTHRFHHVADDDARCVSPAAVAVTAAAFARLVEAALRS